MIDTRTLDAVLALARAAEDEVLPRLSATVVDVTPHSRAVALVGGKITVSDAENVSDPAPSVAEIAVLAERAVPGTPSHGPVMIGGTTHPATTVVASGLPAAGSVLVLTDTAEMPEAYLMLQRLWDIAAVLLVRAGLPPFATTAERFAAGEHAKRLLVARDSHAATLTAILGALRSRQLDDASARQVATAIASAALTSLRAIPVAHEFSAGRAFALLSDQLRPLVRHTGVELEMVPPGNSSDLLPREVGEAATAVARGCVLVMLDQTAPHRIRVAWEVDEGQLTVNIRDDGDGARFPQFLAEYRLRERVSALGGAFTVDAIPSWGTTLTARLPLALPPSADVELLDSLSRRELEVMAELARGLSNQQIAERLHLTEHTIKFHVRRILAKLGARSRGEAAAIARAARF